MAADTWIFRRRYEGHIVKVTAIWMPRTETWGLICRLDGVLADLIQSVDPWNDARAMLDAVLFEQAETLLDDDLMEDVRDIDSVVAPVEVTAIPAGHRVKEGDVEESGAR